MLKITKIEQVKNQLVLKDIFSEYKTIVLNFKQYFFIDFEFKFEDNVFYEIEYLKDGNYSRLFFIITNIESINCDNNMEEFLTYIEILDPVEYNKLRFFHKLNWEESYYIEKKTKME